MSLQLVETNEQVERKVLDAIRRQLHTAFHGAAPIVRRRLAALVRSLVMGTDDYASLVRGDLLGELGLDHAESRLHAILDALERAIAVSVRSPRVLGSRIEGGMRIGLLKADLSELTSLAEASYVSSPSGATIPWLDWLIGQGDRILVLDHDVTFDLSSSQRKASRSGQALMIRGSGWRLPPEFAGVPGDNFLTRAFDIGGVEAEIARILREEIERRLD